MFSWLLVNVVLSILAILFIALNATAPHRLRFLVCFAALLSWLIPWQLVPEFLPLWYGLDLWQIERQLTVSTAEYTLKPIVIMSTGLPVTGNLLAFTLAQLGFIALCASGFLLFCWHVFRHHLRLWQLRRKGEDGAAVLQTRGLTSPVPVIIQGEIAGAFSSGLLKPKIWIHKELTASTQLATLLRHELTHIMQHDNWYLLCITLVEKLFWWNPLVWLLGRQARELQELSCDVLCQRASADYPLHLAELMIDNARLNLAQGSLLLSANIFNRTNLNIKRIKLLQRSYPMKARHLVSTVATAICALAAVGLVTAQPESGDHVFIHSQGSLPVDAEGDVLFVARDPSSPLTEGGAFEGRHLVVQTTGVNVFTDEVGGTSVQMDQYVKIDKEGNDTNVSFSFDNMPLAMVLQPLAHMALNEGIPPFAGGMTHAVAGVPAVREVHMYPGEESGTTATMVGGGHVAAFHTGPAAGVEHIGMAFDHAGPFTMPLSSNLQIEDEADRSRLVSVKADNVTLEAALEIISAEANCNVFLDDDTIVVNSCAN